MSKLLDSVRAIPNAHEPAPGLITSGQPSEQQLRDFAAAGGKVVLDIRDPMEVRPFDEPALARELGLEYINVPVSAGAASEEKLDRILAAVREHRDQPMLFHCGSANRVGGALLPWFILDQKMDADAATEAAMQVGLRSPEFLAWGMDYAGSHG